MRKSFPAVLAAPVVLVLALSGCSGQSSSGQSSSDRSSSDRSSSGASASERRMQEEEQRQAQGQGEAAGAAGGSSSASPSRSPSGPGATAAVSPSADPAAGVCRMVDTAARSQLIAGALALGDENEQDSVVRADTATTYRNFAAELRLIAPQAQGELRSALAKWAGAATAVARYVAEHEPRAGYVIDFGPTEKQWEAGRKAAEKVCGHDLPDLGQ
ncbi:hypothetical protein [Streptomyces mayonensis]|uniref:hypothetical protein n=1 Tax=Streptomyces mayonensis TaxID=2750816 RepID=UPI001C1DE583|nr:hypothetical protein [Streptomyces sp. A108]MBU6535141.1 hypothetical protein [Streptomyces sp. A108]